LVPLPTLLKSTFTGLGFRCLLLAANQPHN
jgi:hypothetical protein